MADLPARWADVAQHLEVPVPGSDRKSTIPFSPDPYRSQFSGTPEEIASKSAEGTYVN